MKIIDYIKRNLTTVLWHNGNKHVSVLIKTELGKFKIVGGW